MSSNQRKPDDLLNDELKRLPKQYLPEHTAQNLLHRIRQQGEQSQRKRGRVMFALQSLVVLSFIALLTFSLVISDDLKSKFFPFTNLVETDVTDGNHDPGLVTGAPAPSSFYLEGTFYYGDRDSFGIKKQDYFTGDNVAELIFFNQDLKALPEVFEVKIKGIHAEDPDSSHLLYQATPRMQVSRHTVEDRLFITPTPVLNFPAPGMWEVHATLNGEWIGSAQIEVLERESIQACSEQDLTQVTLGPDEVYNAVICGEEDLFLVKRSVESLHSLSLEEKLEATMKTLLTGLTEIEKRQDLHSWFSERTAHLLNEVSVKDGIATINLNSQIIYEMNGANTSFGGYILNTQLKNTILQFDEIDGYIMQLDGSCLNYAEWSQVGVCTIVYRDGYEEINVHEDATDFYGPFTLDFGDDKHKELIYTINNEEYNLEHTQVGWRYQVWGNKLGGIVYCPDILACYEKTPFTGVMRDEYLHDAPYTTRFVLDHVKSMKVVQIYHYFVQPDEIKPDGYYLYFFNQGQSPNDDEITEQVARSYLESFRVQER